LYQSLKVFSKFLDFIGTLQPQIPKLADVVIFGLSVLSVSIYWELAPRPPVHLGLET